MLAKIATLSSMTQTPLTLAEWLDAQAEMRRPEDATPEEWLAERVGVHLQSVFRWKAGGAMPRVRYWSAIAEATDGAVTAAGLQRGVEDYQRRRREGVPPRPQRQRRSARVQRPRKARRAKAAEHEPVAVAA
jgi:hypothetical protein